MQLWYDAKRAGGTNWQLISSLNDLSGNGRTGTTAAGKEPIYVARCISTTVRAAGQLAVVGTCLPRTDGGSFDAAFEARRLAYNALILGDPTKYDACADIAADARLQDPADTMYYSDFIHPTSAGAGVIADLMYARVMML